LYTSIERPLGAGLICSKRAAQTGGNKVKQRKNW